MGIAVGGVSALAQDGVQLLREGRPRLEMSAEELAQARADEAQVARARSAADDVLGRTRTSSYRDCFASLPDAAPPPPHQDDWPYWTGVCGELRRYLADTSYAWALTGDRKYLSWCRTLMIAISRWPQWTDPDYGNGQPCLDTHSLTRGMCVAYDYTWEALSERDREQIRGAIADKGAQFIYEYGSREGSYVRTPDLWPNGYAMINTELGVAALTLLGEDDRAGQWLAQAQEKARLFFTEQGGVDGGLVEGFAYGSAAVDNLMYLVEAAQAVAGVDMTGEPYLSQAIFFPVYFVAPGGGSVANFGDNGGPEGCPPSLLGLARAVMKTDESPEAAWYLQRAGVVGEEIEELAEPPTDLPLARHFRSINWVAMRTGWGQQDALLALREGFAAHHNHEDQSSVILAFGRQWLLNDPGYQIYDQPYPPERQMTETIIKNRHAYTAGSFGHNTILVDGKPQIARDATISRFAQTVALSVAVGDASECYGPSVQRYLRHVVSVPPDYYVVFDEVVTDGQERTVELLLHTTQDGQFAVGGRPIALDEERVADEALVSRSEGEALVRIVQPPEISFTHRQYPDCEQYGHMLKLSTRAAASHMICWALAAGPVGRRHWRRGPSRRTGAWWRCRPEQAPEWTRWR